MKLILTLILLLGLFTAWIVPMTEQSRATGLWSDFLTFKSRVEADPAGDRILAYGGENEEENFEVLVNRLRHLNDSSPATLLGLSISILATIGLIVEFRKSVTANDAERLTTRVPDVRREEK